jgi:hypothetical protein
LKPLNLFYEEPDPDRWFKYDHYLRNIIRRIIRGKQRPGGVMTIIINLMKGLDKIGIPYRYNDYNYIHKHPEEIACIIGKPQVLFEKEWQNPVIFGSGIYSHPIECPDLFVRYTNVKRFLVPGEWMRKMCEPYYEDKAVAWPVGIDTDYWAPYEGNKTVDFLIYDKIRWQHSTHQAELIDPVIVELEKHCLTYHFIKYGNYTHGQLVEKLKVSKAVIFLCEHETQGQAYQQILATNTPILAWDRGGYWQDPSYYPDKVKYQPVSSVPYWDGRCGVKFTDADDFAEKLTLFLNQLDLFRPRDYVIEKLTLEICVEKYLEIYRQVETELNEIVTG